MIMRNIYFTKEFVDGTLEGLTYDDVLPYPDEVFRGYYDSVVDDIKTGRIITPCVGGSKYKIISCRAGDPYERDAFAYLQSL